jgi:uncharacterized Rmd1/YagE family protein
MDQLTIVIDSRIGLGAIDAAPSPSSASSSSAPGPGSRPQGDWCRRLGDGSVAVRRLDAGAVATIADVFAQTLLLQSVETRSDAYHDRIAELSSVLRGGGDFIRLKSGVRGVGRLVSECSKIEGTLQIARVGEGPRVGHPAWNDSRYSRLHALLLDDLDVADRVSELRRRLSFAKEQAQYCADNFRDAVIRRLELLIILIIALECVLKVVEIASGHDEGARAAGAKEDGKRDGELASAGASARH